MIVSKIGFLKLSYAAVVNAILVSPGRIFFNEESGRGYLPFAFWLRRVAYGP